MDAAPAWWRRSFGGAGTRFGRRKPVELHGAVHQVVAEVFVLLVATDQGRTLPIISARMQPSAQTSPWAEE
jgi:hypothetical protein